MKAKGFTLIEVIVAMTISAMVFTVAFRSISVSLRTITQVEDSDRRLELVRSKLAELDLCESIRAGDQARGSFSDGTRWRVETSDFVPRTETNAGSLVRVVLTIEWDGRNGVQRREITTYRFALAQPNQLIPSLEDQLREIR